MYEEHKHRVLRIAYGYLKNREDAEEIMQDTFFEVYRNIKLFRKLPREEIISLLVIYTRNNVIDFVRRKKRRIETISLNYEYDEETQEYEIPSQDHMPEELLLRKELGEQLGALIDSLSDAQRDVILLKYKYDMTDKEIARVLKIKESAVSSRLNRAKEKLRELMEAKSLLDIK